MNKCMKVGLVAAALSAVVPAFADAEIEEEEEGAVGWTPFALSLASPVQLPWGSHKWDVFGLNLGIIWTDAPKMYGLDVTGIASASRDDLKGLKVSGLCNWNSADVYGMRVTLGCNYCAGTEYGWDTGLFAVREAMWGVDVEFVGSYQEEFHGVQVAGLANVSKSLCYGAGLAIGCNWAPKMYGFDLAIFNYTKELHGFQLGVVNYAAECPWGMQIGLVNIIMDNSWPVLPIVNFYF
ncbi:MAG: hypothetical protein IJQ65_09995 [Kiritimatiellae bacterium]|nr:hypothetical protein [Kiritimatiellia bacterium]